MAKSSRKVSLINYSLSKAYSPHPPSSPAGTEVPPTIPRISGGVSEGLPRCLRRETPFLALPLAHLPTTLMGCPSASVSCPPLVRLANRGAQQAELPQAEGRETLVGWTYPSEQCPSYTVPAAESWRTGGEDSTVRLDLRAMAGC